MIYRYIWVMGWFKVSPEDSDINKLTYLLELFGIVDIEPMIYPYVTGTISGKERKSSIS